MGRAPRIEFSGAIYHVMNRGNQLGPVFRDDVDRGCFLRTLEGTCVSAGWAVHSFVLMGNHYHLLIETSRPTLVKGMQYLDSTYTRRFNVRHKSFGHLFQGRYKALLVDGEHPGYFLTVSDYIHLNPVRAKRVGDLQELLKDPWSSAGWLAGARRGCPKWLRWERVYGELGLKSWRARARREYRDYLGRRIGEVREAEAAWKPIRQGWCLGTESFVAEMKEKLEEAAERPRVADSWSGVAVEEMEEDRAERWLQAGARALGYAPGETVRGADRYLLGKLVRERTKVRVPWLAEKFGLKTRNGMSHGITWVGRQMEVDRALRRRWERLLRARNVD